MRNVIFDIGNVLVDFHPIPYFQSLMPDGEMETVCPLIFDQVWEDIDRGDYLCETAKQMQIEKLPQYEKQINCIYEHWKEMMYLYKDSFSFMKECKEHGYGVYLLSNIGEESHSYLKEQYEFFDLADGMVLSYQERCIKPERRIFECLLERYDLQAKDCVFFDDRKQNIEVAKAVGMRGIVFCSLEQAKKEANLW